MIARWAVFLSVATAFTAFAEGPIRASRTSVAPIIDGKIDEASWQAATPYSQFTESWPTVGAAPSQKTEVRVLYDDTTIYVAVKCFDTEPNLIERGLGRRDSQPTADLVEMAIDSSFDRRSAYFFSINAAGVLRDMLLYGDVNFSDTWDAVWTGKAATQIDGWSVEFAIPLSILRFPNAVEQHWGFEVRREIPRTHQVFDSTLIPRSANGVVSRFGLLTGLVDVKPKRDLEIVPYAAGRLSWRPQFSNALMPRPRLLDPSLDLGVDIRATLLSDLTLNATVNPDFGQVEADQLILNLSNFELFFPEKRPFFNQGLDLFEPVGDEYGAPHRLLYSRRIGLDTPILAAAKVSGTAGPGIEIGALDAVVMGAADPSKSAIAFADPTVDQLAQVESMPNRGIFFHPARPFHFGLNDELPASRPTPKNFAAVVMRKDFTESLSLGTTFTSVAPLAAACSRSDFATQEAYDAADCLGQGGEVVAVDWNWRSENRDWVFLGLIDASHREGGPREDLQRDGTVIHPGDAGLGGYFKAGKFGGEGWRYTLEGHWSSPKLDLNDMGFLSSQNQNRIRGHLSYVRTEGLTHLRDLTASISAQSFHSTDGLWTPRGDYFNADFELTLLGFHELGAGVNLDIPHYDVREISGYGVPFERRGDFSGYLYGATDPNRAFQVNGSIFVSQMFATGPVPTQVGYGADISAIYRPIPRLETKLDFHFSDDPNGARYVDSFSDRDFLFGQQQSQNFSVTLRQTVVLTPELTLQAYAQLYSAYAHYPEYYAASTGPTGRIDVASLVAMPAAGNYDFHDSALNVNIVARWEYRLGSALFLVYSHSRRELGFGDDQTPTQALFPTRLGPGPATDTVLIKWSYWFNA